VSIGTVPSRARRPFEITPVDRGEWDVGLLYGDLSIDLWYRGLRASCKAVETVASAGRILRGADVRIVVWSAGFRSARDLGVHAIGGINWCPY